MKKFFALLAFLIIVGIFIPAVSAEIIINDDLIKSVDTSVSGMSAYAGPTSNNVPKYLVFDDITKFRDFSYFTCTVSYNLEPSLTAGRHDFNYDFNGQTRPGVVYKEISTNALGQITQTRLTIFLNDWDIGTLSGKKWVTLPFITKSATMKETNYGTGVGVSLGALPSGISVPNCALQAYYTAASTSYWKNHLLVENTTDEIPGYNITLTRTIDGDMFTSGIELYQDENIIYTNTAFGTEFTHWQPQSSINKILISSIYGNFTYTLGSGSATDPDDPGDPDDPDNTSVTIYIRNSQTNALIANANIVISANVNGNFHEIANETVPSGIYSIELQPTGGGMPNPDFYRLITTAEGYNSIMPYIDFEVDGATTIYAYLDPTGGAPEDENNTFIDFYVRDMSANPISGATVNFGGYTLITNSAGYTIFEVDKNKTYSWTVSKSGYGSLTGNAVIGGNARHTINTVLAPAVTPTTPTAIPTSTPISPTPTMTAPTGEPVSNWLEWFAAHFGMILGGGAEIGKIFMWLCFAVPVGVYVGKEAKAGAAGFMAGAGVVTLFFVLIGWVPIWLLVLLALIIGLLYAKVFNNPDNGGGR